MRLKALIAGGESQRARWTTKLFTNTNTKWWLWSDGKELQNWWTNDCQDWSSPSHTRQWTTLTAKSPADTNAIKSRRSKNTLHKLRYQSRQLGKFFKLGRALASDWWISNTRSIRWQVGNKLKSGWKAGATFLNSLSKRFFSIRWKSLMEQEISFFNLCAAASWFFSIRRHIISSHASKSKMEVFKTILFESRSNFPQMSVDVTRLSNSLYL